MAHAAVDAIRLLQIKGMRFFTTKDFALLAGVPLPTAAQVLRRLTQKRLLLKLKRGVWANPLGQKLNELEAVPFLSHPWPSYVSLHSALAEYGLIAELPHGVTAVTPGRPFRIQTPLGFFHFHHLPERHFWGFQHRRAGEAVYPIAEPEKALLDLAYLSQTRRSPIRMPPRRARRWKVDYARLKKYAKRMGPQELLEDILEGERQVDSGRGMVHDKARDRVLSTIKK